jgi:hypothetical protein
VVYELYTFLLPNEEWHPHVETSTPLIEVVRAAFDTCAQEHLRLHSIGLTEIAHGKVSFDPDVLGRV